MLSLLIAHIIITALCLWSGFLFYKFFPLKNGEGRPIIYYAVSGLILLTCLTQIIVLFFPINIYTKLVVLGILVLLSIYKRENTRFFIAKIKISASLILFFIVWIIILLISAGPTIMDDTESYHIQSIKWIQQYGSVPGLVNLHERFGFNSSWFSSVALFSFSSETTGGFTVLNSVLSMWLCYWSISKCNEFQKENNLQAAFSILAIFIACFIIWPLIRGNAATTNYDFIATCIVLILFTEIFFSPGKEISPSIEWIIWPAYLFTVRIVNFPLLILGVVALIIFIKQKKIKTIFLPIAYCLLLVTPFLIRNIIIAGYPFYPANYFDVANVDWKPDPQMTEQLLEYIKYYNRVSTTYLEIHQTKALGSAWIPEWFKYLFLFDKLLVITGILGILLIIAKSFFSKSSYSNKSFLLIPIIIIWIISWFLISPDPRFVYGILLFGVFLLVYQLTGIIKINSLLKNISVILILIMIASSGYYFFSKMWKQDEYRNWILPAKLPQPPVRKIVNDNITFRIPERINNNWNSRCYGTDLPCLYKLDPRLKLRGKNIRNGFHLEK